MQGTEFSAPIRESNVDASAATAPQASPDATHGEAARGTPPRSAGDTSTPSGGAPSEASAALLEPDFSAEAAPMGEASPIDDAALDVSPASDTRALVDAAVDGAPWPSSCDVDGDGYLAMGAPCFGTDCCDIDSNVHPGQAQYFTSPSECGSYDYDCDGIATPEYAVANCQWVGLGCTGDGFVDITACGVTASFSVCTATTAVSCTASVGSLTQACR